ncbi:MAG TPA: hypothetical protein VIN59_05685 [Alphaproteobacteria bacterium]
MLYTADTVIDDIEETREYFFNLHENTSALKDLSHYWPKLPTMDMGPSALARVLFNTSLAIERLANEPDGMRLSLKYRDYVVSNFGDLWINDYKILNRGHAQDINKTLSAFNKLRLKPSGSMFEKFESRIVTDAEDYRLDSSSDSMLAFSQLAYMPETALPVLEEHFFSGLADPKPRSLVKMYWAAAVQEAIAKEEVPFSRHVHEVLSRAFSHLTQTQMEKNFSRNDDRAQLNDASQWFTGEPIMPRPKTDNRQSTWEGYLRDIFAKASDYDLESTDTYLPNLGKWSDFAFRVNGHTVHLEADGPLHFNNHFRTDDYRWNGNTLFQSALVAKTHPDDVQLHLPFFAYQNAVQKGMSTDLIGHELCQLLCRAAHQAEADPEMRTMSIHYSANAGFCFKPL